MIPVLTPSDVKVIDERATETESLEAIVDRAGSVVARQAIEMLGGSYGRKVTVLAGPGLNGADARSAAGKLEARGVRTRVVDLSNMPATLPECDLVIDGVFGIGLSRPWTAPATGASPVLSIDVPSGIDGETGEAVGAPISATRTVTFIGYKSGLLFADGPRHSGEIRIVDIGLDVTSSTADVIEARDVRDWLPIRDRDAHKWRNALLVVAGSTGMTGAATLATSAAMRTGAGYVHLDTPAATVPGLGTEIVASFAGTGVRADTAKFAAAVVGPGLTRTVAAAKLVRAVLSALEVPVVIDGDGLAAVAEAPELLKSRPETACAVLTPHDGEFERLTGERPGPDRFAAVRRLAAATNSIVLLKGPTTLIAHPGGDVRVNLSGDARLATAGTGDVLAGIIGALLAQGVEPFDAASSGAFIHGLAAGLGHERGLVASDLVAKLPEAIDRATN